MYKKYYLYTVQLQKRGRSALEMFYKEKCWYFIDKLRTWGLWSRLRCGAFLTSSWPFNIMFNVCSWAKYKSNLICDSKWTNGFILVMLSYHLSPAVPTGTLLNAPPPPHHSSRRSLTPWPPVSVCSLFVHGVDEGLEREPSQLVPWDSVSGFLFLKAVLIRCVWY